MNNLDKLLETKVLDLIAKMSREELKASLLLATLDEASHKTTVTFSLNMQIMSRL